MAGRLWVSEATSIVSPGEVSRGREESFEQSEMMDTSPEQSQK